MEGKIIKGVGGFYYVCLRDGRIFECNAKGVFRSRRIKPSVGDNVVIDIIDEDRLKGNVADILPRENLLIRPSVSNVEQAVIIFALADPEPNFNLLDRFLIMMARQGVTAHICFNKSDLADASDYSRVKDIYEACGYKVFITSTVSETRDKGTGALFEILKGKTTVLAGPSGVGKSSLINIFKPDAFAKTGEVSAKIRRGRHTTRHSELINICADTYVMDTPGFTSLDVDDIEPSELKNYYNEFEAAEDLCRFNGCVHINEPDCGVKAALLSGMISDLRYDNYRQIYEELKEKRRW